jgi:hypothetical protein
MVLFGALLGIASGAWFALGNVFAPLYWATANPAGVPAVGGTLRLVLEQVGFFTGLGVVIVLLAAAAAGRVTAVPSVTSVMTAGPAIPESREMAEENETEVIG